MGMGHRVREARLTAGWGQAKLAQAVGAMQQAIDALESRDSNRSRYTRDIARVLGVSLRWLATGEGGMYDKEESPYELDDEATLPSAELGQPQGALSELLGLPLRDRFALAAMPLVMESGARPDFPQLATAAYAWADAMLAARGADPAGQPGA